MESVQPQYHSVSLVEALAKAKCPQCRQGNMYKYPFWRVNKFDHMHKTCPHCGLRFEKEPGFFWGATYVSYTISTGIVLITGFILYNFFGNPDPIWYLAVATTVIIGGIPFTFRMARVLFLYVFGGIDYRKDL